MSKFLQRIFVCAALMALPFVAKADDFQVSNSNFEDWSAAQFDGQPQAKGWNASNVEQVGIKFNFAHKETGHNGGYCLMVQDQEVGAMGITATSPGYFALGRPWAYLPGITSINQATAGTSGGITWTHRPDSMAVWIKRTGSDWTKEDFYLLYYSWSGTAKGTSYKNKQKGCTDHTETNEESDIRQALNGNECGTAQKATQVAEGMWRERAQYSNWTKITLPIYYFNNTAPTMMNIIFSASNYPNFRANDGLYAGNSLYVDDVQLIYASTIQKLYVGGREWKAFDPKSTDVQIYELAEDATSIPAIEAFRGAGSLTNARGTTVTFSGRKLEGSEISITNGDLTSTPTVITVKSEDGKSTTTYKIQFQKAAGSNAKLASIAIDGFALSGFNPAKYNYTYDLPYGTTQVPVVTAQKQEDEQKVEIKQATSVNGTATITVTAANGTTKATYSIAFKVGQLADNTLKDILVNGKSIPGFTPTQTVYKVSLPVGTTTMPTVKAVSAYADGEQTIVYTAPSTIDGGQYQISVTTPGNTVAKVYKLNFKIEAASYSLLGDLKVEGNQIQSVSPAKSGEPTVIDFRPELLTYNINLKMGSTTLPKITAVKGDEYQKKPEISSLGEGVVEGTVRITVTAGNGDQTVYKLIFATEKSTVSTLKGIKIDGKNLEGFQPDVTTYSYTLPAGTTQLPSIEPIAGDEYQTITVTEGGVNGKTRISVVAQDGSTTIYQISFSVATYSNNTLAGLYLDGKLIDGFSPTTDEYYVSLKQGSTEADLPTVTYQLQDENFQRASDPKWTTSNDEFTYRITIRPLNGESRTYTIHFAVTKSANTALAMIYVDGQALEGFNPDVLDYEYALPKGVSTIPTVTFLKGEDSQRVLNVLDKKVQRITVTAESGAKRVYTISFIVTASDNSQLEMIYLNGEKLAGFQKNVLEYEVQLPTENCPAITVDKAPGQQVTITAPYGYGEAHIVVKPEAGTANTYIIKFVPMEATSAQLKAILINGVVITNFNPAKTDYQAEYERTRPTIGYVKDYEEQHVDSLWKDNVAWLYVRDSLNNTNGYNITFTKKQVTNNTLSAILIDGVKIPEFNPETETYSRNLPAGSSYPTVTYEKGDETQTVFLGQVAEGKWQIIVTAESGAKRTYKVNISVAPYADATLADLKVEGYTIDFNPSTTTYDLELESGLPLPAVSYEAREGQVVLEHNAENATLIHVSAQDGKHTTYSINYKRTGSTNAYLADLLIDSITIPGFAPNKFSYTYELGEGTEVIPDVFPVAALSNQTITTELSRPRSKTRITVEAEGGAKNVYTISFPVLEAKSTRLGTLTINGVECDVEKFDYEFDVPYGTSETYTIEYTKAEKAQLIEYIDAPITGITKIIVTNSSGEKGTYSIRYNVAQAEGANILKKIKYTYTTSDDELHEGEIANPQKGDNKVDLPFGSKAFAITDVEKNYPGQTVIRFDGSIRRSAKLIVVANRVGEEDMTYTVTPSMPAFQTAGKLQTLKFQNNELPNWNPDVYNYLINVTAEPIAEDFAYTAFDGKTVEVSTIDPVKKQITFTVEGGATYSVCWFYQYDNTYVKDGLHYDYFDFSQSWVPTTNAPMYKATWTSNPKENGKKSTGFKPYGWTVPADLAAGLEYEISIGFTNVVDLFWYTGKEVMAAGVNGAMLSTINGASINGSVPGMMTIGGTMALSPGKAGNSTSSISYTTSKFIQMRNTPDSIGVNYKPLSASNVPSWYIEYKSVDANNTTRTDKFDGSYGNSSWQYASLPLKSVVGGAYPMAKYALTINSCHKANAGDMTGSNTIYTSDLQIENLHFVYNSKLTNFFVDGIKITNHEADTFYYELANGVELFAAPSLTFEQQVHDQMQVIEWLNNGEWLNGELTAKVTNYGENSKDKTEYYVIIKRKNTFNILDFAINKDGKPMSLAEDNDTTEIDIPFGTTVLPDLEIVPNNAHQRFSIEKNGNTVKITVKAENDAEKTKVIVYREKKSTDATLENIELKDDEKKDVELIPAFNPNTFAYQIEATAVPTIKCEKTPGQTVDMKYGYNGVTITVTAENGAKKTYTITLVEPTAPTSGQIKTFKFDGEEISEFGGDNTEYTHERPNYVFFKRDYEKDSVCFKQTPAGMTWDVSNSKNTKTTYTLNYPTSSSNTKLGNILLNGKDFEEFDSNIEEYDIPSEGTVRLEAIAAEEGQKLGAVQSKSVTGDTIIYTITVIAQDGQTRDYLLRVSKPKSLSSELAGILVDGELIPGFRPDSLAYTMVLPSVGAKREEPMMPSLTYVLGQPGQTVTMTAGVLNEQATVFTVHAAAGSNTTSYEVTINSEKSHCTELSGIILNKAALEDFEPGRHYYSVSLHDSVFTFDYTTDDRFQTVTPSLETITPEREYTKKFHVVAQDGSYSDYLIQIYVENPSSDCQLANIKLNNQELSDFERELNAKSPLKFDPSVTVYDIIRPSSMTVLPEVSAQLKMAGQQVSIEQVTDTIFIHVLAPNGTSTNTYRLNFQTYYSQNAQLKAIYMGDSIIPGFKKDKYVYVIQLPEGVHEYPEVSWQEDESVQTIDSVWDEKNDQVQIRVQAEDPSVSNIYNLIFSFTRSAADTLLAIRADGDTIRGFEPHKFHYNYTLPIGTRTFPYLSWDEVNEWQTITLDTVRSLSVEGTQLVRSITVTAENGSSNTYLVTYDIRKSDINTLKQLYVDKTQLKDFDPAITEYYDTLTAERAAELGDDVPEVEYIEGDAYQTVSVSKAPDALGGKCLGHKSVVTVKAESGAPREYTIHYPVALLDSAYLEMIFLNGDSLADFKKETFNYPNIAIGMTDPIPAVTVKKQYDAQNVDTQLDVYLDSITNDQEEVIRVDTLPMMRIVVTAEDTTIKNTYNLVFRREKSSETKLRDIILIRDNKVIPSSLFPYRPDYYEYSVTLDFDGTRTAMAQVPEVEWVKYDEEQTVKADKHELPNGDIQVDVTVIAPNGEDQAIYVITFVFRKPSDATLLSITLGKETIEVDPRNTEYEYAHPYGSTTEDYFKPEQVSYVLSDPLAKATHTIDETGKILITVVAQDGSDLTYFVTQYIAKDDDNWLKSIELDGVEIRDFDPEVTFYTYYLRDGLNPPSILAIPRSENAEIIYGIAAAGDTCEIICKAQDESERIYRIYFAKSEINDALTPTANDVIIIRVPGQNKLLIASIRKNVAFALYDQNGRLVHFEETVPAADPNDVIVFQDVNNKDVFSKLISDKTCRFIDIIPGQVYFYGFYTSEKVFKSGKIMCRP